MSAPTITSSLVSSATGGTSFSYQITASDTPTSYNATGLPTGLAIDTATGLITGIPVFPTTFAVGLSASNGDGTGSASLVLTVNPPSSVSNSYRSNRLQAFNAKVSASMYGTSFSFKGVDYPCIADPQTMQDRMQPDNYLRETPARFDMYATNDDLATYNFASSGIEIKSIISFQGTEFQVFSITRDPKEPTVILRANRKQ